MSRSGWRRSAAALAAGVITLAAPPAAADEPVVSPDEARLLARIIAYGGYGWHYGPEWDCLDALWQHESGWNYWADNPNSSAYGIPQALTELHGLDEAWMADPMAQILWGLDYIRGRYGDPCTAWDAWKSRATPNGDGTYHGGWY